MPQKNGNSINENKKHMDRIKASKRMVNAQYNTLQLLYSSDKYNVQYRLELNDEYDIAVKARSIKRSYHEVIHLLPESNKSSKFKFF